VVMPMLHGRALRECVNECFARARSLDELTQELDRGCALHQTGPESSVHNLSATAELPLGEE
jgi:hypothetical protein